MRDGLPPTGEQTITHAEAGPRGAAIQLLVFGDGWSAMHDVPTGAAELTIGRDDDCEIHVDDKSVSRRHAVLVMGPPILIRDLQSSNGVEVDGVRLGRGETVALRPGSRIRLGGVSVAIYGEGPTPAALAGDDLEPGDPMAEAYELCDQVAASELPVLLLGETGTGKEVLAERLHARSSRATKPLLRLNAATVPEALAESQLFGHERGAFTGAAQAKDGLIFAANGGTLLLDEIGDLSPPVQTKLLRVLETGAMMRVGATQEIFADVRYVAATSRDVDRLVEDGTLRSDLVYRLAGVTVYLPPLRDRPMAILSLARKFLHAASGGRARLAPDAERSLHSHDWPGNVRELKVTLHRAAVLSSFGVVEARHLALGALRLGARRPVHGDAANAERRMTEPPPPIPPPPATPRTAPPPPATSVTEPPSLREDIHAVERERILAALAACGGNQTRAAEMLGISRRTLTSKLDRLDYVRPRKPAG